MNIANRFTEYADAFEVTYKDDDWSRLEPYFTDHASYDGGDGSPAAQGRAAVLEKLHAAVDGIDRRMDSRTVQFGAPTVEGNTVTTPWEARYTKSGVPDLLVAGTEYASYEGDRIARLRDEFAPGTPEILGEWMAEHGHVLQS